MVNFFCLINLFVPDLRHEIHAITRKCGFAEILSVGGGQTLPHSGEILHTNCITIDKNIFSNGVQKLDNVTFVSLDTMLSILIPIYNFDVRAFVTDLREQSLGAGIDFEILCLDDYSGESYRIKNRELSALSNVVYEELGSNVGRSAIRNKLAQKARYPYLLFTDCDSQTEDSNYIQNYIDHLTEGLLVYGGRSYAPTLPSEDLLLHWKYGRERETKSLERRRQVPFKSFMTNNFVVPKSIALQIGFDEEINGYGHEDTLFGKRLGEAGYRIVHIQNPLRHIGLEPTVLFLDKAKKAVENLAILYRSGKLGREDAKLIQAYHQVRMFGLKKMTLRMLQNREKRTKEQLCGPNPSLRLLDQWKLMLFIQFMHD